MGDDRNMILKKFFPRQTSELFAMAINSQCRLVQPATIIFIFALSWPCYADEHQTNSSRSIVQQGIIEIPDYVEAIKVAKEKSAMLLVSIRAKNRTDTNDLLLNNLQTLLSEKFLFVQKHYGFFVNLILTRLQPLSFIQILFNNSVKDRVYL